MIDLHNHLLPGIDDGAPDWDETLRMAQVAWQDGIRTMAVTPHLLWNNRENRYDFVTKLAGEVAIFLEGNGIPMRILPGTEMPTKPESLELLKAGRLPTYGESRCILLEPPFGILPPDMDRFVDRFIQAGYRLLFAHPERCRSLQDRPELINSILPPDVPFQLTSHSLTGEFGPRPLDAALALMSLKRPMVISTDAHSSDHRAPRLREAVQVAALSVGPEYAEQMVMELPQALLEDRPVWNPPA